MTNPLLKLPSKQQILDFLQSQSEPVGKREIARAFGLKGEHRMPLKALLKEMEREGAFSKDIARPHSGRLPEMLVLEAIKGDGPGKLRARPVSWKVGEPLPKIFLASARKGAISLALGDRALCRLYRLKSGGYEARPIQVMGKTSAQIVGVFHPRPDGSGEVQPTSRREKGVYRVPRDATQGAEAGDLVVCDYLPGHNQSLKHVSVRQRIGRADAPRSVSLIAIHANDIPVDFSDAALAEAAAHGPAPLGSRVDLREIPLVTIDGEDARDFDDAVWAEPEGDGWRCLVAIADVSWYVRPNDALDRDAAVRGNSVYFPDRVVPMLPEALSNGWCSLRPGEDRGCLAVWFHLDREGNKTKHHFVRGLMRSSARLTYAQVQAMADGEEAVAAEGVISSVIEPLFGAWRALLAARTRRGVLELELPERKVELNEDGTVQAIVPRPRFDSHRLIEDFMIQANVCAAEELERLQQPCMYRIHDRPSPDKLESLHQVLIGLKLSLGKGKDAVRPEHFNRTLAAVKGTPHQLMVNELVLRSQAQAVYSPENIGHFGLGLAKYAHFTSPIRRYADLLVHRSLVAGLKLGEGGLPPEARGGFPELGEQISLTERRAAQAERDATDRFVAAFLADRVGARFAAKISGITSAGLFVSLLLTGADGLVPMGTLTPRDHYLHDKLKQQLIGRRTRKIYSIGQEVTVMLKEANPLTGGMRFSLEPR